MSSAQPTVAGIAGLGGILLVAVSLAGITATLMDPGSPAATAASTPPRVGEGPEPAAPETPATRPEVIVQPARMPTHYPLDVGRYWVYRYREQDSDVVTEIERVIVRRETRLEGADLFFFDDGGVVYFENGKVFEMGTSGGVNIIPVEAGNEATPIVYRTQGLQIEKWFGAVDTSVVVGGRRFAGCLEVVTRFREIDAGQSVSYSSFYAPGVGMVGRQSWPRDEAGTLSVTLAGHGTRRL